MRKTECLVLAYILVLITGCGRHPESLTGNVNPFIGTGGHGHTYPGVSLPFGMVQLSPDTRLDGWDGCSAYHASDSVIYGFSHTHLSGTGCSDYGDILVMPVTGEPSLAKYSYRSGFRAASEEASPGYYKVDLDAFGIRAELTATLRAGFHRYTFPASGNAGIVFDLKHRDKVLESELHVISPTEIEGMRISREWAQKQILYFVARFSRPFDSWKSLPVITNHVTNGSIKGDTVITVFNFKTEKGAKILVKVGISAVSYDGARKNLDEEIPGWDFDLIRKEAGDAWNGELGKVAIKGGTRDQQIVFYTSLYHALLNPNLYMDVDGSYRGRDLQVHSADGFDYYTVFSLWDTYRAAHPLFTILEEKRTVDFIRTFLQQYREGGELPVWELSGNETGCMIGYHSVPVIADAYLKGIRGFDADMALEAMRHSAEQDHLGLADYRSKGFIPGDKEGESVSKTLEYAYDDWCIAQMAKEMGKTGVYRDYIRRAQYYKNIFDPSTGFMRAKMNETWFSPFDPAEVNFNYTEANAWQYSFYVPQDVSGLIQMLGETAKFAAKLDAMFAAQTATTGRNQADITGQIGQYAHGNEPSHHMAYLYNYAGQPWKTQELVHRILTTLYSNDRDGLCGNEDCGQMSSWFVLSAMGFYPVTPGSGIYDIGIPLFPEIKIQLENGKTFTIKATGLSDRNFYIQSATLDGKEYQKCFITHEDILAGKELAFVMGPVPNKAWGSKPGDYPVSAISDELITPVPSVETGKRTFQDSTLITLSCPLPGAVIRYTLDGKPADKNAMVYIKPFVIRDRTILKAVTFRDGMSASFPIEAVFDRIPKNRKITLNTKYAGQYSAGGDIALIDFVRGGPNFRTGTWQGYDGVDLDAVIDLGQVQKLDRLSAGFLQDPGSWIFYPVEVDYYLSTDGKNFKQAASVKNDVPDDRQIATTKEFTAALRGAKARYIRVLAKNRGVCPPWHAGAGQKAWIFADEITIN
jgi:predicted alpha-1,2-mannosidase